MPALDVGTKECKDVSLLPTKPPHRQLRNLQEICSTVLYMTIDLPFQEVIANPVETRASNEKVTIMLSLHHFV